jgi:hypothetical protein
MVVDAAAEDRTAADRQALWNRVATRGAGRSKSGAQTRAILEVA